MFSKKKECTKCEKKKALKEFHRNSTMSDGHGAWCKACMKTLGSVYRDRVNGFLNEWKQDNNLDCSRKDAAILYAINKPEVIQEFQSKLVETDDGCLLFTGNTKSYNGYGMFNILVEQGMSRVNVKAHRFAFALYNGWLPKGVSGNTRDGIVLNHTCHQRLCQAEAHLEAITCGENNAYRKPKK